MAVVSIRRAQATDLDALLALEQQCFLPEIQETRASMRRSLKSPHQEVWVADRNGAVGGALFLRLYKRSLRIYSVAVDQREQGKGLGGELMRRALQRATELGKVSLSLEVNADDASLIRWYEGKSFRKQRRLPGYYSVSKDAWKMVRLVEEIDS